MGLEVILMSTNNKTLIGVLEKIADGMGNEYKIPNEAKSDPREEVIVRYTEGTGEFSKDMKYNVLRMKMFKMTGEPDGTHDGVWEP